MKLHRHWLIPVAILAMTWSILGQRTTAENPFPEIGQKTDNEIFDTNVQVGLTGVITQQITRPTTTSPAILYFRVSSKDGASGNTVNWTVRIPPVAHGLYALDLINDYSPEMDKLTVGTAIKVVGNPARDKSNRLSMLPQFGPGTIAGVAVLPGR
jgi:hypothetical protein